LQVCYFYRTFYPISVGGVESQIYLTSNLLSKIDASLHFTLFTDRQYFFSKLHSNVPKTQNYGTLKVYRLGPNLPEAVLFAFKHYLHVSKERSRRVQKLVVSRLFSEASMREEVKNADVFHTHVAGEDLMDLAICEDLPIMLSAYFGKPLVVQLHGTFLPGPEMMHLGDERGTAVLDDACAILTHNLNVFEKLREWGFEKKSVVVPICIDLEEFKPIAGSWKRRGFEIAFVGRLSEYRDPETAVRAFAILRQKFPSSKLHILGSGPLESSVRSLIRMLGVDESAFVYGARRDVADFLKRCDVFWATSPVNNYPSSSLMEALASGLPVVATDTGLTRKLITDSQNGLLIAANSPIELAAATERILTDDDIYQHLAMNARSTAEKYDCTVSYQEIAKLYHDVTRKPVDF
jgi:glycosyltransferase involved in cell wall biosynthesis